ncbi:hypothetical protein VTJ83DRAFT_2863 [Remersonia thermophila]|uniref:DUF1857-domain-containing protein n=1 Tax=Remersonia thermophila TaxID=72144 RepID=A0ABR4DCJ7_9PEZI
MVTINLAYTAPINPPSASPALTLAQVWEGLVHKVRRADLFVPVITSCQVLKEETNNSNRQEVDVITRRVTFRASTALTASETVVEVCHLYPPCRVDFKQEDGTLIGNYVSEGPDGELYMTYMFEWRIPGVMAGSEEAKALEDKYRKVARMAVEGSINTIRAIARGEITIH